MIWPDVGLFGVTSANCGPAWSDMCLDSMKFRPMSTELGPEFAYLGEKALAISTDLGPIPPTIFGRCRQSQHSVQYSGNLVG